MAYINKKDFSIMADDITDLQGMEEDYFECDDIIAPTISLLNKKGYRTTFCCGGHPFPIIDCGLMKDYPTEDDLIEIELLKVMNITDEVKKLFEDTYNVDEFNHCIVYKNIYAQQLYIAFDKAYNFDLCKIPEDALIDNEYGVFVIHMLYTDDLFCPSGFEGITKIYEANKKLYEWAESLPDLNKED